jgi:hypothetical protein
MLRAPVAANPICGKWTPSTNNHCFCEARFAGLSPWFALFVVLVLLLVVVVYIFGLVRRALCIFAPRSTINELLLIAITLFSQGRVAAWP